MDSIFFISPVSEHKFLFLELLFDGLSTNLQLLHLHELKHTHAHTHKLIKAHALTHTCTHTHAHTHTQTKKNPHASTHTRREKEWITAWMSQLN